MARPVPREPIPERAACIRDVLYTVAFHFGVQPADILRTARGSKRVSQARNATVAICRDLTLSTYCEIAFVLGRDHSTVVHAVHAAARRAKADFAFAKELAACRFACLEQLKARRVA